MRMWQRLYVRRYFGLDDVFIILAFVRILTAGLIYNADTNCSYSALGLPASSRWAIGIMAGIGICGMSERITLNVSFLYKILSLAIMLISGQDP
jgi:hypothetical protein